MGVHGFSADRDIETALPMIPLNDEDYGPDAGNEP